MQTVRTWLAPALYPDDTILRDRFSAWCEVLDYIGLAPHPVEKLVLGELHRQHKRNLRLDEGTFVNVVNFNRKPGKSLEDHRSHFESTVAWVKGQLGPDGKIYDRTAQKLYYSPRHIANYLSLKNSSVGPEHVERAQDELRGKKAA